MRDFKSVKVILDVEEKCPRCHSKEIDIMPYEALVFNEDRTECTRTTFLRAFCPHCNKRLTLGERITVYTF